MVPKKKKILFISHEANLSGAPILLLNLLKKIKNNAHFSFDILLIKNGDLYDDFAAIAENIYVADQKPQKNSFIARNLNRIKNLFFPNRASQDIKNELVKKLPLNDYDLIYGSTIASLDFLATFQKHNTNTVIAIHELSFALESIMEKNQIIEKIKNIRYIIAGSKAVANNLIEQYQIEESKINIIHSFVEKEILLTIDKFILKQKYNINEDEFIIGIASSQELRKGTDLVPYLVKKIIQKKPDLKFKFINLGGTSKNATVRCSILDAKKLGVENYIIYIDHNIHSNDYINLYDIFLLLSREDPFPLVMLTAAQLGKPIIAFKKSGGAEEFLEEGHGILIPYLDIDAYAEELIALLENPKRLKELGNRIKTLLNNKYSEEIIVQKNITFLEKISTLH